MFAASASASMASPLPFVLNRRVRSNKDTFVDPSEREPEAPPPVVGQPIVFAQPAPDAVVEEASTSDGRVRCARHSRTWHCNRMFVPVLTHQGKLQTRCERCRAIAIRQNNTQKGKASRKRFRDSDKGKALMKRKNASEKAKERKKRYKDSDEGKASEKRYYAGDKGKAKRKRMQSTMSFRISVKIRKMCRDGGIQSVSALKATGCASTAELRAHFETTFEPWMNWSNQGAHKAGGNSGTWQIGHRLARAFYDDSNPADIKRCWNKANLFAQDADENHALSVKMPDDAVLERLRALDLLPCAWGGIVPPAAQRAEMERTVRLNVALR